MAQYKSPQKLAKLLSYILGHRPDEFGLVPDPDGFVKVKDLLKATCEEESLKFIRRSHLDEIIITLPDPPIEIQDNCIRSISRDKLPWPAPAQHLPKLLYTCVRRKAYAHVLKKGIFPMGHRYVILTPKKKLAERMGKRIDQTPVVLIVSVEKSTKNRVVFLQAGELINLAETIPPGCFSGPPLPKEKPLPQKPEPISLPDSKRRPGSFLLDIEKRQRPATPSDHKKRRKAVDWKKDRKKARKQKPAKERPPWRR
jgi:putative RNA 2'-phosphotransferase